MTTTIRSDRPIAVERVELFGFHATPTIGLKMSAVSIRMYVPNGDGEQQRIEFILGATHVEDLQKALAQMEHWPADSVIDPTRAKRIVVVQADSVLVDDEL